MTAQTKTGYVGEGMNTGNFAQFHPKPVGFQGGFQQPFAVLVGGQALFHGRRHHASAQGLGQVQGVTGLGSSVALQMRQRDQARNSQTKQGLGIVHAVAAPQGNSRFQTHVAPAPNHFGGHIGRQ